jgi:hypothetical protein
MAYNIVIHNRINIRFIRKKVEKTYNYRVSFRPWSPSAPPEAGKLVRNLSFFVPVFRTIPDLPTGQAGALCSLKALPKAGTVPCFWCGNDISVGWWHPAYTKKPYINFNTKEGNILIKMPYYNQNNVHRGATLV